MNRARAFRWIGLFILSMAGCGIITPLVPERITRLFLDVRSSAAGSIFSAVQIDPASEDEAGPQLLATGDLDGDDLLDVVTVWNQSKPIQVHFQRRDGADISFETITLVGDFPTTLSAGVGVADMDADGRNDVVVQVKESGVFATCRTTGETLDSQDAPAGVLLIFFAPADAANVTNPLAWELLTLKQSQTAGAAPALPETPETGGYTSMTLGDIDGLNGPDILVAFNANECEATGNRIELYLNPGPANARQSNAWVPLPLETDAPPVKDVKTFDVDRDGDLDVVCTYPMARGLNLRWLRNPTVDVPDAFHVSDATWRRGAIGQVVNGADVLTFGDIDNDDITDVVVRSTTGMVVYWFKGPPNPTTEPIRNITWQGFAIAEFTSRAPEAIALGDVNQDGQLDLFASAGGAIVWLQAFSPGTVFDQWAEILIADDSPPEQSRPAVTDPNVNPSEVVVTSTIINALQIVDLDGDGRLDLLATLDRRGQAGITNDAVIWYRNLGG